MGREIVRFKSEERQDRAGVATFLRELADHVGRGEVTLRRGEQEIRLALPEQVTLELKVEEEEKKGRTKHSLEVEIEWGEGDEAGGVRLG